LEKLNKQLQLDVLRISSEKENLQTTHDTMREKLSLENERVKSHFNIYSSKLERALQEHTLEKNNFSTYISSLENKIEILHTAHKEKEVKCVEAESKYKESQN